MQWSDLRDASKVPPKAASGQVVWTPPTVQQEAHFLSTLDPLRHSPHQVADGAQSREVCGKQQTPAAETICRLANCFVAHAQKRGVIIRATVLTTSSSSGMLTKWLKQMVQGTPCSGCWNTLISKPQLDQR